MRRCSKRLVVGKVDGRRIITGLITLRDQVQYVLYVRRCFFHFLFLQEQKKTSLRERLKKVNNKDVALFHFLKDVGPVFLHFLESGKRILQRYPLVRWVIHLFLSVDIRKGRFRIEAVDGVIRAGVGVIVELIVPETVVDES